MTRGLRGRRMRDLLIGGIVGASAAVAALRRQRPPVRVGGLAAFEQAPCYREAVDSTATSRRSRS